MSRDEARVDALVRISRGLGAVVDGMSFSPPVTHVYNPLGYARTIHEGYLRRFGGGRKEAVFLGMNPGPWGMAQTGIPFGEVAAVRDWMGLDGAVESFPGEHPKRPVRGFDCTRSEVSGRRLWGWASDHFGAPECFFDRFLVLNYCPLMFLEESGRNRTPDKLPAAERAPLEAACDAALGELVEALEPEWVIGVGKFAERRARLALDGVDLRIGTVLHPSPASPAANRGWREQAVAQLGALGIEL